MRVGVLQRKCACGGNAESGSTCDDCAKAKLQRKAAGFDEAGIAADEARYEAEADRVADQVLSHSHADLSRGVLAKPFDPMELPRLVSEALGW